MTSAIWYFFASGASFSTVGPGTCSAASYQRLSWPGQKYGPLKISCMQRIWTPFLPASWIIGRCFSSIAAWISATDLVSSLIGFDAWMRPLSTLRAMGWLLEWRETTGLPQATTPVQPGSVVEGESLLRWREAVRLETRRDDVPFARVLLKESAHSPGLIRRLHA